MKREKKNIKMSVKNLKNLKKKCDRLIKKRTSGMMFTFIGILIMLSFFLPVYLGILDIIIKNAMHLLYIHGFVIFIYFLFLFLYYIASRKKVKEIKGLKDYIKTYENYEDVDEIEIPFNAVSEMNAIKWNIDKFVPIGMIFFLSIVVSFFIFI